MIGIHALVHQLPGGLRPVRLDVVRRVDGCRGEAIVSELGFECAMERPFSRRAVPGGRRRLEGPDTPIVSALLLNVYESELFGFSIVIAVIRNLTNVPGAVIPLINEEVLRRTRGLLVVSAKLI